MASFTFSGTGTLSAAALVAAIISEAAGTPDVGVVISGCHSCMSARGIRNTSANTVTTTFKGKFRTDKDLQKLITE